MRSPGPLPMSIAQVPFTLDSALRRGVSRGRTRAGDLSTPSRGIRIPTKAEIAFLDSCRTLTEVTPNGVISHLTAARIHGLYLPHRFREQQLFDLAKPAGDARPRRKQVHGRELALARDDIVVYAGIPVTTMRRTLLDLAPLLTIDELVDVADQLVCEHHRSFGPPVYPLVPLDALNAYIAGHPGHRGMRKLLKAMELVRVGSDSPPETKLRLMIGRWPLPVFEHNVEIRNAAGIGKVGPDLACEEYKTCAEYDGLHHFSPAQQAKDHDRDYITKALGVAPGAHKQGRYRGR
ncbi:hypothetical protein [Arthrobacter alpinus]|nr:hypothetical protein [Arthrobacter alpinus]